MFSYRKRQHRAKTYGLWTLILLLYNHTAYASMNVLNCPSVGDPNGVYKPVCHYISLYLIHCSDQSLFIIYYRDGILMLQLNVSMTLVTLSWDYGQLWC